MWEPTNLSLGHLLQLLSQIVERAIQQMSTLLYAICQHGSLIRQHGGLQLLVLLLECYDKTRLVLARIFSITDKAYSLTAILLTHLLELLMQLLQSYALGGCGGHGTCPVLLADALQLATQLEH